TSGRPEALELFRTVLLSSAAIPAVFPPGFIKVAADGALYDEMHVDGGATREVFLVPTQFMANKIDGRLGISPIRRAYIIRNGHVAPEYKPVKARTLSIAGRAVSRLIKSQGVGDLYELYLIAKRNNMDYNLAYIPADFIDNSTRPSIRSTWGSSTTSASAWPRQAIPGRRLRRVWSATNGLSLLRRNKFSLLSVDLGFRT